MKRGGMNHQQREKTALHLKIKCRKYNRAKCAVLMDMERKFPPPFFVASFLFPPNISVSISIQNSYMSTQNDWIMFLIIPQRTVFSCYRLNKRQNQISDGWINVSNFFWVRSDTCAYLIESILNLFMAFFFSFAQISFFSSFHCCLLLYLTYFRFSPSDKE